MKKLEYYKIDSTAKAILQSIKKDVHYDNIECTEILGITHLLKDNYQLSSSIDITNQSEEEHAYDYENTYVHKVYDAIADQFSQTRHTVWPGVNDFLIHIGNDARVLEIGCGNGKNLESLTWVSEKYGCDMSMKFVEMVRKKGITCNPANALDLPYKKDCFTHVLCVAVLHHLSTKARRLQAVKEIIRVTAPGGHIYIQVWALDQDFDGNPNRRIFTEQDSLVGWKDTTTNTEYQRFYHLFEKNELDDLVIEAGKLNLQQNDCQVKIVMSEYCRGNWIVELQKTIEENVSM